MKLQSINRYEDYKVNGDQCLGDVSQYWTIKRLKDIGIDGLANGIFKTKDQFGSGVKLVNVTDLYQNNSIINNEKLDRVCATQSEVNRYCVRDGDIFFVRSSLKLEGIGVSAIFENGTEATVFECHIIRFRPNQKHIFPKFAIYQLNSNEIRYKFVAVSKTVTMTTISQDKISTVDLLYPPLPEQQAIAAYLDTKTAQIDRKIDLLIQKATQYGKLKQSLINETVTRGLHKTVAMKDSGVEWIGEVPAHWDVKRIKDTTYVKGRIGWQGLRNEDFLVNGSYYCVTGTDLKHGSIDWSNCYYVDQERYKQDIYIQLKIDDILITKDGTIGKVAIVKDIPLPATLNSGVFVTRSLKNSYVTKFMYWVLNSYQFTAYIDLTKGGSTIQHLYQNVFNRFIFTSPSLLEQQAIANYLNEKTAHIDRIVATINSQIDKLKELRKTLINDVVTGKICVLSESAQEV